MVAPQYQAWHGPALVDKLPGRGASELTLGNNPAKAALHIDVPRKTLGAWQTADAMGFFQDLAEPVGRVAEPRCWEDHFEETGDLDAKEL